MRHIQGLAATLLLAAAPTLASAQTSLPSGSAGGRSTTTNEQERGTAPSRSAPDGVVPGQETTQGQAGQQGRQGQQGRPGQPATAGGATGGQLDDQTFLAAAREGGQAELMLSQLAAERASSDEVKQFARQMIEDHTALSQQLEQAGGAAGGRQQPGGAAGGRQPGANDRTALDRDPDAPPAGDPNTARLETPERTARINAQDERRPAGTDAPARDADAQVDAARPLAGAEARQAARPAFGDHHAQGLTAGHQAAYQILSAKTGEDFDRCYIKGQVAAHMCAVGLFEAESQMGQSEQLRQVASEALPKLKHHLQMAKQLMGPEDPSTSPAGLEQPAPGGGANPFGGQDANRPEPGTDRPAPGTDTPQRP